MAIDAVSGTWRAEDPVTWLKVGWLGNISPVSEYVGKQALLAVRGGGAGGEQAGTQAV